MECYLSSSYTKHFQPNSGALSECSAGGVDSSATGGRECQTFQIKTIPIQILQGQKCERREQNNNTRLSHHVIAALEQSCGSEGTSGGRPIKDPELQSLRITSNISISG
jgi:hypothetical protein